VSEYGGPNRDRAYRVDPCEDTEIPRGQRGHLLVALMVGIAVMTILLTAAAEKWSTILRRDREEELIFRGRQYAQALTEFQKEQGALPMDLNFLLKKGPKNHRYIRQLFKDPFSKDGKWGRLVLAPGGQAVVNPLTQEMRPTAMLPKGAATQAPLPGQPVGPQTPQDFGLRQQRGSQRFPGRGQPPQPPGGNLFRSSVTQVSPFPPEQLAYAPIAGVASTNLKLKSFKIYEGYDWVRDFWFTAYNLGQGQAQPAAAQAPWMPSGLGPQGTIQGTGPTKQRRQQPGFAPRSQSQRPQMQ